jgi:RNA polymerase sigma-70 factor (ECF subfamily)
LDIKNLSDFQLVELLKEGDSDAYSEIYNRYHAALYVHVFNKLRLREESRDIVHELFASLWSKRNETDIKGNLSTYLYVSARYKIFDFIARRDTESKYISSIKEFIDRNTYITDYLVREKELQVLIDQEIAALPPKMQKIFELSRSKHLTHKQIADELGLSEQTVKKQVQNALKILRSRLGPAIFIAFIL